MRLFLGGGWYLAADLEGCAVSVFSVLGSILMMVRWSPNSENKRMQTLFNVALGETGDCCVNVFPVNHMATSRAAVRPNHLYILENYRPSIISIELQPKLLLICTNLLYSLEQDTLWENATDTSNAFQWILLSILPQHTNTNTARHLPYASFSVAHSLTSGFHLILTRPVTWELLLLLCGS